MSFANAAPVSCAELADALARQLTPEAADWLEGALAEAAEDTPGMLRRHFTQAGRRAGGGLLAGPTPPEQIPSTAPTVPAEALAWTVDDAVRALLLAAAPTDHTADLYHGGSGAERRGVLRALGVLDLPGEALPLVADALRTHDPRLIAAALGPYGASWLTDHAYRQAVLKCLHVAIPLSAIAGLPQRADRHLARLALDYAHELACAGRPVRDDLWKLITPVPPLRIPCASSTRTST